MAFTGSPSKVKVSFSRVEIQLRIASSAALLRAPLA